MPGQTFIDDQGELRALAPVTTAPIRHHVFVCTGKSCSARDSAEVKDAFERELKARGILFGREVKGKNPKGSVVLNPPVAMLADVRRAAVMIYPDGIWYAQVRATDVAEIIEEHLMNGRVVERLALLKLPADGSTEESSAEADWEA